MQATSFLVSGLLLATGFLTACSPANEKDPLLDEAARYHQQATAIQATIEPQLDRADSLKAVFMARKGPAAQSAIQSLDSLKAAFDAWESNVVEVPGMPHHHAHGSHEHHHTDTGLNGLPADQMRDLQREMLRSIQQIQGRLERLTQATH